MEVVAGEHNTEVRGQPRGGMTWARGTAGWILSRVVDVNLLVRLAGIHTLPECISYSKFFFSYNEHNAYVHCTASTANGVLHPTLVHGSRPPLTPRPPLGASNACLVGENPTCSVPAL